MSTSFKCPLCKRYLSSRQEYSRHLNKCLKKVDAEEPISDITSDVNDMSFDDDSFRKIQEPEYSADVSFSSTSNESYMVGNDENEESEQFLPNQLQDYSFNLKEFNEESRKEPEEPEESSEEPDEEFDEESEEEFEEEFEEEPNEKESEIEEEPEEEFKHFPNEAYADLMELILNHNNIEYFVYYRPIKNCIQKLLLNPKLSDQLLYNYELLEVISF